MSRPLDPDRPGSTSMGAPLVRLLGWLAFYATLTCWMAWPLPAQLSTSLPCTNPACGFDTRFSAWALAWESHALVTATAEIGDGNIYHPAPDALYYGPAGFGALPYFFPIFVMTGDAAVATNVMLLLSATLSALALHWVVQRWTGLASAGVVAAASLLVNRWYLWGFVGATPHLAPLQYFPLIVWLASRRLERTPQAVLLLVLVVAQCLTDAVYVAASVLIPLAVLAAARLVRPDWRRSGLLLAGVVAAAGICLLPFFGGYVRVRSANPGLATQSLWQGWIPPSDLSSLYWRFAHPTTIVPAAMVLIAAGGALALLRRRRGRPSPLDHAWLHGLLWTLLGGAMSLTPTVRWGEHEVVLPQSLLAATTPFYEIIRSPERLGVAAMIGACLLCGLAFAEVVLALGRAVPSAVPVTAWRSALAALAAVALYAIPPAGTQPFLPAFPTKRVPVLPDEIVAELSRSRAPLLHLPALSRVRGTIPSSSSNATAMFLSTRHWRPLLNGYSSYWPAGFLERMHAAEELPAQPALARLVRETGVETVLVDASAYGKAQRERWRRAALGQVAGLTLRVRSGQQMVFAIDRSVVLDELDPPGEVAVQTPAR